jgi:F-type H+-transporting ATPase subunit delta
MLARLEGYAAAVLSSLEPDALATVTGELASLEQTILGRSDLRGVLSDTSISGAVRGLILADLLQGKVGAVAVRLATFAVSSASAQDVPHAVGELSVMARDFQDAGVLVPENLGKMDARRRVAGYCEAQLEEIGTEHFAQIEGELFVWARTIEANAELRRLVLDRDAPLDARLGATEQLLANKVQPVTLRLARYVIEGGRPRDVVGTLDFLVDYVARARDWRVARVRTARPLDEASRDQLASSLAVLTGKNVELQIDEEPDLLGGVLVEVGDLRLDATTRGRLGELHDAVVAGRLDGNELNRNE